MKLIVQGKQMQVPPGLKRYAEKHLVQPLRRFYDNEAAELRIELGRANGNRGESLECHLTLHMPGGKTIQIEQSMPDLYGALEGAAHRLLRVARKELDKKRWPKGRRKPHPLSAVVVE
jgi:ribosomal subunit interface protein